MAFIKIEDQDNVDAPGGAEVGPAINFTGSQVSSVEDAGGGFVRIVFKYPEAAITARATNIVKNTDVACADVADAIQYISGLAAFKKGGGGGEIEWTDILNVPDTFPPSAHTHTVSEITDYPAGTTAGEIQKWDDVGGAWVGTAGNVYVDTLSRLVAHNTSSLLQVVRTEAQLAAADFTKPILIDGEITLTSTISFTGTGVENVTILGLGQGNSKLIAPPASTALQVSDSNLFLKEVDVEVPNGSLGIELTSISGSETLEVRDCLFSGEGNKISVQGIRQFFADVCAFFGDGYAVQVGDTLGGFSMTNCIALFKTDGVPLIQNNIGKPASFASRLIVEKSRFELGASAPFTDLTPTSFDVADLFQLSTSRFERSGVADATDTTIFPAITKGDLPSLWLNNTGIKNTLIGGEAKVIGTSTISIAAPNTYYEVFGDLGFNSLEHFSGFVGVLANRLRNDGAYVEGVCVGSVSFTGTANDVIDLQIVKTDGVTPTVVRHIETTINNLSGSVDRAKIDFNFSMELDTNEELYMEVENKTAARDVTVEIDSFIAFRKR